MQKYTTCENRKYQIDRIYKMHTVFNVETFYGGKHHGQQRITISENIKKRTYYNTLCTECNSHTWLLEYGAARSCSLSLSLSDTHLSYTTSLYSVLFYSSPFIMFALGVFILIHRIGYLQPWSLLFPTSK